MIFPRDKLSTCTPRQLSATMTLYLRSLGIEDGAAQARDGRSCPAEISAWT